MVRCPKVPFDCQSKGTNRFLCISSQCEQKKQNSTTGTSSLGSTFGWKQGSRPCDPCFLGEHETHLLLLLAVPLQGCTHPLKKYSDAFFSIVNPSLPFLAQTLCISESKRRKQNKARNQVSPYSVSGHYLQLSPWLSLSHTHLPFSFNHSSVMSLPHCGLNFTKLNLLHRTFVDPATVAQETNMALSRIPDLISSLEGPSVCP